jgi:GTP cyclohydrolase I
LRAFLESLGADFTTSERLRETPATVTRFLAPYLAERDEPEISLFPFQGDTVVSLNGLRFHALCEHHLLPFFGTVDLAYVPEGQIAGFGGIERVIAHYAHRLTLQERLTQEIAEHLFRALQPRGLRLRLRARQLCLELTGGTPEAAILSMAARGFVATIPPVAA